MKEINHYIDTVFASQDPLLEEIRLSIKEHDMPSISVSSSTGKLLTMLVSISGAKNVLEIGALGGFSGVCLARGFGADGMLTSLELEEKHVSLAQQNLSRAGFGSQVSYLTGEALQSLERLISEQKRFDFFFIDADKDNYTDYLQACLQLAEPGALIVADNVLARGSVADEAVEARRHTELMRAFNRRVAEHPGLESVLVPLGDGLTISRVKG